MKNTRKSWTCDICGTSYNKKNDFNNHMKRHLGSEKKFKCMLCQKMFQFEAFLEKHINGVHNKERPFKCEVCNASFKDKGVLKTHQNTIHKKESVKYSYCPHCEYKTYNKANLNIHIESVHLGLRLHKCDECGKGFTQGSHLKTHRKNVHLKEKDPRFQCDECSKSFNSNQQLRSHQIRLHSSIKQFHCEVCDKGWNSERELYRHSFVHKDESERPLECSGCPKRFVWNKELKDHQKTCNVPKEKRENVQDPRYFCTECSKYLSGRQSFREHNIRVHSSNKSFKCGLCDYATTTIGCLKRHAYTHQTRETWPHQCQRCKTRFIRPDDLRRHQKSCLNKDKTKLKMTESASLQSLKYRCHICDYQNKSLAGLKVHNFHKHQSKDTLPYKCQNCAKGFVQRCKFILHLKVCVDGDIKKVTCSKCQRKFINDDELKKHQELICGSKVYDHECKVCGIKYSSRIGLKYHTNKMHPHSTSSVKHPQNVEN